MATRLQVSAMVVVLLLASLGAYEYSTLTAPNPCSPLGGRTKVESQVKQVEFGAITEYQLPTPNRYPNSIVEAPDGSVWFGETGIPGVGHLFPGNGTLVEYAWPRAYPIPQGAGCSAERTDTWGIAVWNGKVWATVMVMNSMEGLDPADGSVQSVNLTIPSASPYTLTVGPSGSLWFTLLTTGKARIGVVSSDLSLAIYPVLQHTKELPTQIAFANSSYAYYTGLNPLNSTDSGVYAFNPQNVSGGVASKRVGGNFTLVQPDSVALAAHSLWVAQHAVSMIAAYNTTMSRWTLYPTSLFNYVVQDSTLPYFMSSEGGIVWFNEHYGNSIARLDPKSGTMSEYSEANPPITKGTEIQNDVTIGQGTNGLWFTSLSGNYIGFASNSYTPPFSLAVNGSNTLTIPRGGQKAVNFELDGSWTGNLAINSSDTENYIAVPRLISVSPTTKEVAPGRTSFQVTISVNSSLTTGRYTVAVTAEQGILRQTAFLFLSVT